LGDRIWIITQQFEGIEDAGDVFINSFRDLEPLVGY
jgi:hypothetical protein